MMQPRFDKRVGSGPFTLVDQPRFRAGFDFMRLRADVGEVDEVLADWWQEFSLASDAEREDLMDQTREASQRGPRRVRAAKPAGEGAAGRGGRENRDDRATHGDNARREEEGDETEATGEGPGEGADSGASPARKRRRRRRKPGGGAGNS